MVPTLANHGSSFKGAAAYYLHDKGAGTAERVAWTHTENLATDNPDRGWRLMAWTATHAADLKRAAGSKMTGRKLTKPVAAFSVSWHPDQKPDQAHMLATAKAAAAALGLAEHQAVYVSHNDEPHPHVHVLINRVHPLTGLAATLSRSKEKLQAWALAYEQEHGRIYCEARQENARRRALPAAERKAVGKEGNPAIAAAWQQSDTGRSFVAALKAQGFTLAQGNRRLVVIDRYGKASNPVRELPDVRAAAFKAKLIDLDFSTLPTAASAQATARAGERSKYHAARKYDRWAADYLNQNQTRHIEERAATNARYQQQLADRKDELAKQYKTVQLQATVTRLQERTAEAGIFRRLAGTAAKERAELAAAERQLADVRQRTAEHLAAVTTAWDYATSDLADRQARENALAREHVAERRPTAYADEQAPQRGRGGRGGRDRDDGGRERVQYRTARPPAFNV